MIPMRTQWGCCTSFKQQQFVEPGECERPWEFSSARGNRKSLKGERISPISINSTAALAWALGFP